MRTKTRRVSSSPRMWHRRWASVTRPPGSVVHAGLNPAVGSVQERESGAARGSAPSWSFRLCAACSPPRRSLVSITGTDVPPPAAEGHVTDVIAGRAADSAARAATECPGIRPPLQTFGLAEARVWALRIAALESGVAARVVPEWSLRIHACLLQAWFGLALRRMQGGRPLPSPLLRRGRTDSA